MQKDSGDYGMLIMAMKQSTLLKYAFDLLYIICIYYIMCLSGLITESSKESPAKRVVKVLRFWRYVG